MALILLVEDDLLNREMIGRYLLIQGFEVITAVDGAQAVALAHGATARPDLDGYGPADPERLAGDRADQSGSRARARSRSWRSPPTRWPRIAIAPTRSAAMISRPSRSISSSSKPRSRRCWQAGARD